jgi:hypothetical protein
MVEEVCLYSAEFMISSGWEVCMGMVFEGVVLVSFVLHAWEHLSISITCLLPILYPSTVLDTSLV